MPCQVSSCSGLAGQLQGLRIEQSSTTVVHEADMAATQPEFQHFLKVSCCAVGSLLCFRHFLKAHLVLSQQLAPVHNPKAGGIHRGKLEELTQTPCLCHTAQSFWHHCKRTVAACECARCLRAAAAGPKLYPGHTWCMVGDRYHHSTLIVLLDTRS